jgi:hypothetical protein
VEHLHVVPICRERINSAAQEQLAWYGNVLQHINDAAAQDMRHAD